jgi:hypothetical protein
VDKYSKSDSLIISGDLKARVGNQPVPNVVGTFGEDCISRNGQTLREFASFNDLKITNTFFRKKTVTNAHGVLEHLNLLLTTS